MVLMNISCGLEEHVDHIANFFQILKPSTMEEALSRDYAVD